MPLPLSPPKKKIQIKVRNVHSSHFQLPLDTDSVVDTHLVTNTISPDKDVDGYVKFLITSYSVIIVLLVRLILNFIFVMTLRWESI